jgi:hypothetical protein
MSSEDTDRRKLQKRFPTMKARLVADTTTDALSPNTPMTAYVDTWIAAYRAAGGHEPKVSED